MGENKIGSWQSLVGWALARVEKVTRFRMIQNLAETICSSDSLPQVRFQQHHSVYSRTVEKFKHDLGKTMLVATHGRDVACAKQARMRTAFAKRTGQY